LGKITKLKIEILKSDMTQKSVAKRAGINEGVLSQIAKGKLIPDSCQKMKISKAMGLKEKDLF